MKKIDGLLQGQVPPNQTPSTEADEKAAVKQYYIDQAKTRPDYSKTPSTADLVARAMAAGARAAALEKEKASKTVVQLPLWPDAVRGTPNATVRSALFGVIRRGRREYIEREKISIPTVDGISILYTGPRLDQNDLDVWLQCLHLARTQALGTQIYFSAHSFLKAIGRTPKGKQNHEWLQGAFCRLMGAVVEIKVGKRAYAGQLIKDWYRDDETKENVLVLNPKLIDLFAEDSWTSLQWSERMALRGQQLAQWLHSFYSTHADPHPIKVETIRRLCGSENKDLFGFRRDLREALAVLAKATGWGWRIDEDDLVRITKTSTASQARHLVRRRGRLPKLRK